MNVAVQMRIRGYIYLALALALGSGLGSLYKEAAAQVQERSRINTRFSKIVPEGTMIGLARRVYDSQAVFNDVSTLVRDNEKVNMEATAAWEDMRDNARFKYMLLTTTSYIGAFSAPEALASKKSFLPGILETLIFLSLALFFFWRAGVPVKEKAPVLQYGRD